MFQCQGGTYTEPLKARMRRIMRAEAGPYFWQRQAQARECLSYPLSRICTDRNRLETDSIRFLSGYPSRLFNHVVMPGSAEVPGTTQQQWRWRPVIIDGLSAALPSSDFESGDSDRPLKIFKMRYCHGRTCRNTTDRVGAHLRHRSTLRMLLSNHTPFSDAGCR
jgi:hypothetical protein